MKEPVILCEQNKELRTKIVEYAEALKKGAHTIGTHGLSEQEFYDSGLFRGAIERIRGQFAATMKDKRAFVATILDYMEQKGFIDGWKSAGEANRYDYQVVLTNGKIAAIELKGCLDGNNTNIFERPPHANEFIIWSICQNPGANPRKNVWSGIHTRLSAEIINSSQVVDGLVVWDMMCGTVGRPCPKLELAPSLSTNIGTYNVPPPCIYLFPATVPSPRNNPAPKPHNIGDVQLLKAFYDCFKCGTNDLNQVFIDVSYQHAETVRKTKLVRNGKIISESKPTSIKRA
jgi:hypothetical protein